METIAPSVEAADFSKITNEDFIEAVMRHSERGQSAAICIKPGNPEKGGWKAKNYDDVFDPIPSDLNNYLACSSFRFAKDSDFNVKKENFTAYHFILFDDVGTKISEGKFAGITPSWKIETSPGNYQIGIRLKKPLTKIDRADNLINALIRAGLSDKGATGVGRWARLPQAINGKPKYEVNGQPFHCRLVDWNPDIAYSTKFLIQHFDLKKKKSIEVPNSLSVENSPAETTTNSVLIELKKAGLYKKEIAPGKHDITCPWVEEHTNQLDDGAAYFEPNEKYPKGGFKCHHSHGEDLSIHDLLSFLGLGRPILRIEPGQMDEMLTAVGQILSEDSNIFYYGTFMGKIQTSLSGEIEFSAFKNSDLTLLLAQKINWLKYNSSRGWIPSDPPERHVKILFDGSGGSDDISELKGIVRQPYFRESDGKLVTEPSYDSISKLYGAFNPQEFKRLEPTKENAEKSLQLLRDLLSEFKFVDIQDEAVTLAAIFTAVVRLSLDLAPGFHVHASTIGSGKSYLCKLLALFASAAPSEKVSYPKNGEDATKKMLSLFMKSPACIEFDDMNGNWKPFTILKQAFTSDVVTDRLLGGNKTATVSTRVLILGSGNNVEPERDMRRRVMTIHLDPQVETPATLSYNGNPVETVKANRGEYVMAVLNIIAAWLVAGSPKRQLATIASYNGDWTTYCRQPLGWLDVDDPIESLTEQINHDPDREILGNVLQEWYAAFGETPTTIRAALIDRSHGFNYEHETLIEAIEELPVMEHGKINKKKLGWFIGQNVNKIVGDLKFVKRRADGRVAWAAVEVNPPNP